MQQSNLPVYYIIATCQSFVGGVSVWNIVDCIECTLGDINKLYYEKVEPVLLYSGVTVTTFIFYREPPNVLRDMNNG